LLFRADKGKKYPVKLSAVEIIPDPVHPGQPATFNISASTGMVCLTATDLANFAPLFVANLLSFTLTDVVSSTFGLSGSLEVFDVLGAMGVLVGYFTW
jgi:hypothetical protein